MMVEKGSAIKSIKLVLYARCPPGFVGLSRIGSVKYKKTFTKPKTNTGMALIAKRIIILFSFIKK